MEKHLPLLLLQKLHVKQCGSQQRLAHGTEPHAGQQSPKASLAGAAGGDHMCRSDPLLRWEVQRAPAPVHQSSSPASSRRPLAAVPGGLWQGCAATGLHLSRARDRRWGSRGCAAGLARDAARGGHCAGARGGNGEPCHGSLPPSLSSAPSRAQYVPRACRRLRLADSRLWAASALYYKCFCNICYADFHIKCLF